MKNGHTNSFWLQRSRSGLNEKHPHEGARVASAYHMLGARQTLVFHFLLPNKYEVPNIYFRWEKKNTNPTCWSYKWLLTTGVSLLRGKWRKEGRNGYYSWISSQYNYKAFFLSCLTPAIHFSLPYIWPILSGSPSLCPQFLHPTWQSANQMDNCSA